MPTFFAKSKDRHASFIWYRTHRNIHHTRVQYILRHCRKNPPTFVFFFFFFFFASSFVCVVGHIRPMWPSSSPCGIRWRRNSGLCTRARVRRTKLTRKQSTEAASPVPNRLANKSFALHCDWTPNAQTHTTARRQWQWRSDRRAARRWRKEKTCARVHIAARELNRPKQGVVCTCDGQAAGSTCSKDGQSDGHEQPTTINHLAGENFSPKAPTHSPSMITQSPTHFGTRILVHSTTHAGRASKTIKFNDIKYTGILPNHMRVMLRKISGNSNISIYLVFRILSRPFCFWFTSYWTLDGSATCHK